MIDRKSRELLERVTPELLEQHLRRSGWILQETVMDHGDRRASLDIWTKTRGDGMILESLAPTPGRPHGPASCTRTVGELAILEDRTLHEILEKILTEEPGQETGRERIEVTVRTMPKELEEFTPFLKDNNVLLMAFKLGFLRSLEGQLRQEFPNVNFSLQDGGEEESWVKPEDESGDETAAVIGQWLDDWEGQDGCNIGRILAMNDGRLMAMNDGMTAVAAKRVETTDRRRE